MNATTFILASVFASASLDNTSDDAFARGVKNRSDSAEARKWFFRAAVDYREEWRGTHRAGAAVAYGRASYLAGDLPEAITAFRAGLRRFPADREMQRGLEFCREDARSQGAVGSVPRPEWRNRFSPGTRIGFAAFASCIFSFGLWSRFTVRARTASLCIGIGVLGLVATAVSEGQCAREEARDVANPPWVLRYDAALRTGNGETYPPRLAALLPLGTEVREIGKRGGWIHIELETGETGWLPEEALLKVE